MSNAELANLHAAAAVDEQYEDNRKGRNRPRTVVRREERVAEFRDGLNQVVDFGTDLMPIVGTAKAAADLPEDMALAEDLLRSGYDEGDIKRMGLGAGFTALIALGFIPGVKAAADVAKRTVKEGVTSGAEELTTQTARAFGVGPDKQKNLITGERQKQLDAAAKLPANERRAFLKAANRPTPKIFHAQPTHGLDTEIQHGNQFAIAIDEMDASRKKFLENNKYAIFRYDEGTDDTNLNIPLSAFEDRVQDDGRFSPAFGEGIEESTLVSGTDEGVFRREELRDVFARREGDAFKVFLGYRLAGDVGPTSVTEEVMLPIRKNADGEDAIFYSDFEDVIAQSVEERKNALPSYEDMGYTYPTKAEQLEAEGFMPFDEYRKAGGEKGRHSELDMFAISTARDPSVAMKSGFADRDLGNVLVADYPIERPIADMPPELYARAYGEGPIGMSRGELIAAAARERAGISLPKSVHLESEIAFQNPEDLDLRRLSTEPKIVDEPLDEVVSTYGRTPTLESAADLKPLRDIMRGKPISGKARAVLRARQREAFESPEYTFDTRLQSGTTGQRSSPESFSVADMRGSDIESTRRRVIASQATFNQINENINSLGAQGVSLRKDGDQLSVPYNDETLGDAMQIREATRFYDDYLQNLNDIFKLGQYTEQYGARGGVDNALDRIFNADIRGGLFGASRILPPGEKRNLMDTLFQISKERANVSFTSPDSRATMTTRNISDRVLADALLRHKPRSNFSAEELSQLERSGIEVEGGVRGRPNISINMYGTHRMGHRDIKRIIELASRSMNEGGLVDRSEMTPEQRKEEFVEGMKQTADLATDIAPVVSTAKGIAELPEDLRTIRDLVYAGVEERDPKKVGMGVMYAGLTGAGMIPGVRVGAKAAKKSIDEMVSVFPKPERMFPEGERPKGGEYINPATGEVLSGRNVSSANIKINPDGKPSFKVSNDDVETVGSTGKGKSNIRVNLFKKKAGWKWQNAPEDYKSVETLVSVEHKGKHYYTVETDFTSGVNLKKYPDSKTEPRLRPTLIGSVELGEPIGTISVRGKQHPVYSKISTFKRGGLMAPR